MNLYELFKKFETEFLAGHEKIKTELDFELFVGKLSEQILGDVYSLDTVYKTGGNHIEVTAVGYGYSFEVEYHITKHKLLKLAVINTLFGDRFTKQYSILLITLTKLVIFTNYSIILPRS